MGLSPAFREEEPGPATQPAPTWGGKTRTLYCNRISPKRLDPAALCCCSSPACAHAHTRVCEMRGQWLFLELIPHVHTQVGQHSCLCQSQQLCARHLGPSPSVLQAGGWTGPGKHGSSLPGRVLDPGALWEWGAILVKACLDRLGISTNKCISSDTEPASAKTGFISRGSVQDTGFTSLSSDVLCITFSLGLFPQGSPQLSTCIQPA